MEWTIRFRAEECQASVGGNLRVSAVPDQLYSRIDPVAAGENHPVAIIGNCRFRRPGCTAFRVARCQVRPQFDAAQTHYVIVCDVRWTRLPCHPSHTASSPRAMTSPSFWLDQLLNQRVTGNVIEVGMRGQQDAYVLEPKPQLGHIRANQRHALIEATIEKNVAG